MRLLGQTYLTLELTALEQVYDTVQTAFAYTFHRLIVRTQPVCLQLFLLFIIIGWQMKHRTSVFIQIALEAGNETIQLHVNKMGSILQQRTPKLKLGARLGSASQELLSKQM
jgi:hypothetical protein